VAVRVPQLCNFAGKSATPLNAPSGVVTCSDFWVSADGQFQCEQLNTIARQNIVNDVNGIFNIGPSICQPLTCPCNFTFPQFA